MKRIRSILLIAVLLCLLGNGRSAKAAGADIWRGQYAKILDNPSLVSDYLNVSYENTYFGGDFYFSGYFLCDVDNNGIPELFLRSNHSLTAVLTCTNEGRIIGLSIDGYYKINKKKHVLVVKGHWHGAGGSGIYEYAIYKIAGKEIKDQAYIDKMSSYTVRVNGNYLRGSRSKYNKVYKKYVAGGRLFENYQFYSLKDKTGLSVIQE